MKYTDIITFEDACKKLDINPEEIKISYPDKISHHALALVAHAKLVIIADAINDGWKPDWSNGKWDKYYPWFDMRSSASGGFSYFVYVCSYSSSFVGSRLCFETEEKAKYAGTQFKELYEAYFVIKA